MTHMKIHKYIDTHPHTKPGGRVQTTGLISPLEYNQQGVRQCEREQDISILLLLLTICLLCLYPFHFQNLQSQIVILESDQHKY